MIVVVATLVIKPGSVEALRAPAAACIAATRAEQGCIAYDLFHSMTDAEKLVFVEKWETREALTAHSRQPHLAAWREASAPHLVSRTIEIVHPERIEEF
ncbi:MAG TPA: antibiotic biosynthesis monooxygenase [Rhizobiales bacterium]|nr:antibiotic biosynthesis monooxygenase [Hyphomicrobiales bacterium]